MIKLTELRPSPSGGLPIPTECLFNPACIVRVYPRTDISATMLVMTQGADVPVKENPQDIYERIQSQ